MTCFDYSWNVDNWCSFWFGALPDVSKFFTFIKVFCYRWSFRVKQFNADFLRNTNLLYLTHKTRKAYIGQVLLRAHALHSFAQDFSTSSASGYGAINNTVIIKRVTQLRMDWCRAFILLEIVISATGINESFTISQPIYIAEKPLKNASLQWTWGIDFSPCH